LEAKETGVLGRTNNLPFEYDTNRIRNKKLGMDTQTCRQTDTQIAM
jgi:hypothetical protein